MCYTDTVTSTTVLEVGKLSEVVDTVFPIEVYQLRAEYGEEENGEMVGLGESDLHHHYHVNVSSQ